MHTVSTNQIGDILHFNDNKSTSIHFRINLNHVNHNSAATLFIQLFYI